MTAIALAVLGTIGATSFVALVASLAHKAGAAGAAAKAIGGLPAVDLHTKSATFNEALDAAGNTVETMLKNTLSGAELDAFLVFLTTAPNAAAVLAYVETHFGGTFVTQAEAALPALLKAELGILGHSVPGILGTIIAKAAPVVATQAGAQKLSATQILAGLTAASAAPAPAIAPKAA